MDFLKEHGRLDEFIEAKLLGMDDLAKWHLLDTAKPKINQIVKKTKEKEEFIKEKDI